MPEFNANKIINADKWEVTKLTFSGLRLCGSGRFSNVYSTEIRYPEQRKVAIKNVWSEGDRKCTVEECVEVRILAKLYHPAISNLRYFYSQTVNEKNIHSLVLDFLPTDMAKHRDRGYRFDTLDAKLYTYQLFCACNYLSKKNVVHLDIKPQNIVLDVDKCLLKLADFGNSRRLDTAEARGHSYQVTRHYRPPELLFGSETFTPAIDIWSAACVSFEFFANRVLFKGKDTQDQLALVLSVLGYPTDDDIKSMKVRRPRIARKPGRGLEKFTSNVLDGIIYDFLKSVIVMNPAKRKSAEEVLKMPIFDVIKMKERILRTNGTDIPSLEHYINLEHSRKEERIARSPSTSHNSLKSKKSKKKMEKRSSSSSSESLKIRTQ